MWSFNREVHSSDIIKENIQWYGPYSWPNFEDYNQQEKMTDVEGVYLWTFEFREGFLIYSTGITNSTKRRFATHTREYKKGNYTVLDVNAAQKGERKEIWHGWQYAKLNREEFITKKEVILNSVNEQLKSFRVFIAHVPDKRKRERLEAAIMQNIYVSMEYWSELADRGMHLKGRYNSEIPIEIKNDCKYKIYGLDELFEI